MAETEAPAAHDAAFRKAWEQHDALIATLAGIVDQAIHCKITLGQMRARFAEEVRRGRS